MFGYLIFINVIVAIEKMYIKHLTVSVWPDFQTPFQILQYTFSLLYSLLGVRECGQTWSCGWYLKRNNFILEFVNSFFPCSELTSADEQTSNELKSCKNQCPKNLATCGHRCSSNCHAGPCPSPELCNRKSAVRCLCRRKKRVSLYPQFYSKVMSQHWDIALICSWHFLLDGLCFL